MCSENMNEGAESPDRPASMWPESLAGLGAVRFARHYYHFKEAVHFYGDLVGLPVYETFEGSYGSNGVILRYARCLADVRACRGRRAGDG